MEDKQSDLRITRSAVADLHGTLASYRDKPIESVAAELQTMLEHACQEARGAPGRVSVVYDTVDSDYNRQIYQLRFVDGDRFYTLIGVVADDYDRRTGQPIKVLITVISIKAAKKSILLGRWRNLDGTPIQLPTRAAEPAPEPAPAPALAPTIDPGAVLAPTIAPDAALALKIAPAPAAPSEVPVGRDGRPKRGFRRGGSTTERDEFVLDILRREPETSTTGQNGIHARVRERFGVGMREAHVGRLRAQLAIERARLGLALDQAPAQGTPIGAGASATPGLSATVGQLLRAYDMLKSAQRSANEALARLRALTSSTNEV